MADIKPTILLLCKHLNLLYKMNIQPEMFRLAKYNKSDDNVVETFWRLLSNIIQAKSENVVQNVKHYFLYKLKYESAHLYSLPENMSHGSRELLVAFAYILAQGYLNKYVENAITNSAFNPNAQLEPAEGVPYRIENYSLNLKQLKTEDDFENALEWIQGQINCNKKAVLDYQDHYQKLSTKILESTLTNSKMESLSLLEIVALNNEASAKEFLQKTETISKIVQNHERWLKKQSIFWAWMNSVLHERKKDQCVPKYLEELDEFVRCEIIK